MLEDLNIDNVKVGVGISTYTMDDTPKERFDIIKRSFDSLLEYLENTYLDIYVIIVADGSIPTIHYDIITETSKKNNKISVLHKSMNRGVAKTKNTCIRKILEKKCDIGFLLDDDVLYKNDCLEKYCETMIKGNIHHMGYCQMPEVVHPKHEWKSMGYYEKTIINKHGEKINVMRHGGEGVGCLLTFTPELIHSIGYFVILKGKYGYEHINFTHRAIKKGMIQYACDIINSHQYIDHIGFEPVGYNKFKKSHSIPETYRVNENKKNKYDWDKNLNNYEVCLE
jgi:glycosyltransferase involved in cell wall biosynthesis